MRLVRAKMGYAKGMASAWQPSADMPKMSERSEFSVLVDVPRSLGLQRSPHI